MKTEQIIRRFRSGRGHRDSGVYRLDARALACAECPRTSEHPRSSAVGRPRQENVHDQLRKLAAHGIVEFVEEGNAKRPIVAYDQIVFDFSVSLKSERDHTDEPAAA